MIKTTPMNADWFERLKARGLTAETVFEDGRYEDLKKLLLAEGGGAVVFVGEIDNYDSIMDKPNIFLAEDEKVILKKGRPCDCYANVERLVKKDPSLVAFEGFALSEDGAWRPHAWAYDYHTLRLIETTTKRLAYIGASV